VRPSFARIPLDLQVTGDPLSGHNLNQRMQAAVRVLPPFMTKCLPSKKLAE